MPRWSFRRNYRRHSAIESCDSFILQDRSPELGNVLNDVSRSVHVDFKLEHFSTILGYFLGEFVFYGTLSRLLCIGYDFKNKYTDLMRPILRDCGKLAVCWAFCWFFSIFFVLWSFIMLNINFPSFDRPVQYRCFVQYHTFHPCEIIKVPWDVSVS